MKGKILSEGVFEYVSSYNGEEKITEVFLNARRIHGVVTCELQTESSYKILTIKYVEGELMAFWVHNRREVSNINWAGSNVYVLGSVNPLVSHQYETVILAYLMRNYLKLFTLRERVTCARLLLT